MKANELRIGNFVYDDDVVLSKIIGFAPYDDSIRCDEEEGCMLLLDLYYQDGSIGEGYENELCKSKPIQLTKEWLLKFGFVQDKIDKSFVLNSFSIFLDKRIKDNVYLKSIDGFGNFTWNVASGLKVQYVHQLQNLYFALTGEELIIK